MPPSGGTESEVLECMSRECHLGFLASRNKSVISAMLLALYGPRFFLDITMF